MQPSDEQNLEDIYKSFKTISETSKNLKLCLDDIWNKSISLHSIQNINQESIQKYLNTLQKLLDNHKFVDTTGNLHFNIFFIRNS